MIRLSNGEPFIRIERQVSGTARLPHTAVLVDGELAHREVKGGDSFDCLHDVVLPGAWLA